MAQDAKAQTSVSVPSVEKIAQRAALVTTEPPLRSGSAQDATLDRRARIGALPPPASRSSEDESPNRFRGALLGSTFGVGLSAGLILIASWSDWGRRYDNDYYGDREPQEATGLALLVVLGSAPVGAAIGSGLADEGLLGEGVLTGVLGEFVVGGTTALAGAGIASRAGGSNRGQNVAAAVGLSAGAAVGAALGATLVGRQHEEALSYRDGAWRIGLPFPSVRPVLQDRPSVGVHVPLVHARF